MKLSLSYDWSCDPERSGRCTSTPTFIVRLHLEGLGSTSAEVVSQEGDLDAGIVRTLRYSQRPNAPGPVRKMFGDEIIDDRTEPLRSEDVDRDVHDHAGNHGGQDARRGIDPPGRVENGRTVETFDPRRQGQDLRRRTRRGALHRAPGPRDPGEVGRLHASRARGLSRPTRLHARCSSGSLDLRPGGTPVCGPRPSVARQGGAPNDRVVCVDEQDRVAAGGQPDPSGPAFGAPRGVLAHCGGDDKEVARWRSQRLRRGPGGHSRPGGRSSLSTSSSTGSTSSPRANAGPRPRDIFGMWAGASVQIEYFIYGAILMTFGFTFAQALVAHRASATCPSSCSGCARLQGPTPGPRSSPSTGPASAPTAHGRSRSSTGSPRSASRSRASSSSSAPAWCCMIKAGFVPGDPAKVFFVIVAVLIQGILPFLGHATIVKTLRALIIPFVVLFAILLGFSIGHATPERGRPRRRLAELHGGPWPSPSP